MTQQATILHDFHSQRPGHQARQADILEWLAEAHTQSDLALQPAATADEREALLRKFRKMIQRFGCGPDRIHTRNTALDDFTHTGWDRMRIFPLNQFPSGRPCQERSQFYRERTGQAFERFYAEEAEPPAVLIHVTCTGYLAPSGAQRLVAGRDWGRSTEVIHAYHMGCYASLPAVRLAAGFVGGGRSRVDLVHTELCTLHMDPSQHMPEQLVVQTLFADGLIRYSASPDNDGHQGLRVLATREELVPDTEEDMTWMASEFGMRMTLSRKVPEHIRAYLGGFLERLAAGAGRTAPQLCERALFAIHPGGPRIIDELAGLLGLRPEQVQASNAVLREYGNMSSATLPHVWKALLEDPAVPDATPIVSLAFGPGLTVSGAILQKCG